MASAREALGQIQKEIVAQEAKVLAGERAQERISFLKGQASVYVKMALAEEKAEVEAKTVKADSNKKRKAQ